MWQRFTERARRVVFFAQEEAGRLGYNEVDTEHLLLGLVRENDTVAAQILDRLGVSLGKIRAEMERQVTRGEGRLGQDMQLTAHSKRTIDLAYDEARRLNSNYIGTEHLLLGLIRVEEGLASRVLVGAGVDLERARREVVAIQDGRQALPDAERRSRPPSQRQTRPSSERAGDLGVLQPAEGRDEVELAADEEAFVEFVYTFLARDHWGYRELEAAGRIVRVPGGTPVKILDFDPDGPAAKEGGCRVRVLDGPFAGRAGWVANGNLEVTGPDDTPFPPEIGDREA